MYAHLLWRSSYLHHIGPGHVREIRIISPRGLCSRPLFTHRLWHPEMNLGLNSDTSQKNSCMFFFTQTLLLLLFKNLLWVWFLLNIDNYNDQTKRPYMRNSVPIGNIMVIKWTFLMTGRKLNTYTRIYY